MSGISEMTERGLHSWLVGELLLFFFPHHTARGRKSPGPLLRFYTKTQWSAVAHCYWVTQRRAGKEVLTKKEPIVSAGNGMALAIYSRISFFAACRRVSSVNYWTVCGQGYLFFPCQPHAFLPETSHRLRLTPHWPYSFSVQLLGLPHKSSWCQSLYGFWNLTFEIHFSQQEYKCMCLPSDGWFGEQ